MDVRSELIKFVNESLLRGEGDVQPDTSLIDLGIVDSVGLMELMSFLEERTGLRIPDNFQSVEAMEKMLETLKGS